MNFTLGIDYAPGHYPANDKRNFEAQANVYPEIRQLKAAGFDAVRMYGDPAKVWIPMIDAARQNNMKVVYEVALCKANPDTGACFDGTGDFTTEANESVNQLRQVIAQVGKDVFQQVVSLILVGNEVLVTNQSNTKSSAPLIVGVLHQVRQVLSENGLSIPCSYSIEADVLMGDKDLGRQELVGQLQPGEPLAINVYPFQWGVEVGKSVSDSWTEHSIAWYQEQLTKKYPNHPLLIAETGWATSGTNPHYVGKTPGTLADAENYCQQLYTYVNANNIPLLFFMAFDQPTKEADPADAENHYGVFVSACDLKSAKLLPNAQYDPQNRGCSDNTAIFTFAGGSNDQQPPFTIHYQLTPTAPVETLTVPTANRSNQQVTPWPTITLQPGSPVTLTGHSGKSSSNTVASIGNDHSGGIWQNPGPDSSSGVNWAGGESGQPQQAVFLPADF